MKICPARDLRKYYIIKATMAFILYVSHRSRFLTLLSHLIVTALRIIYSTSFIWIKTPMLGGVMMLSEVKHQLSDAAWVCTWAVCFQSLCPPRCHWEAMGCVQTAREPPRTGFKSSTATQRSCSSSLRLRSSSVKYHSTYAADVIKLKKVIEFKSPVCMRCLAQSKHSIRFGY